MEAHLPSILAPTRRLHARTEGEVRAMYEGLEESSRLVVLDDLAKLPPPVRA